MAPTFRRGTLDDAPAVYDVFVATSVDLERRMGTPEDKNIWADPAWIADYWRQRRSLFEHLTRTAEQFWLAEEEGRIIGYARATLHDGMRELIDFFVLPGHQSGGVGRDLLARAFPADGARLRAIIGTTDIRALTRYLKAGVYPRFPIYAISRKPEPVDIATDLTFTSVTAGSDTLAALRTIDHAILGFARDADHEFLLNDRQAVLCHRGGHLAGYSYSGNGTGPIALLDEADFPAVLARAETEAAARNDEEFWLNVPLINRAAVDYLLSQGHRFEDFTVLFFSNEAFGRFENYILSSPPFFM